MSRSLPSRPHLDHLRKQAKSLLRDLQSGNAAAADRASSHPQFTGSSLEQLQVAFKLSDAQLVIAGEYGFDSWPKLKKHVEESSVSDETRVDVAIEAMLAGRLERADALLGNDASLSESNIYLAAAAGNAEVARRLLDESPELATRAGGPRGWEPLLYVCHSRLLRSDSPQSRQMVEMARLLLDLGANPNAFFRVNDDPNAKQTALYGAAGIANNAALTKLLLDAGADPNDGAPGLGPESLYHAAEFEDHTCLRVILEAGPDPDKVSYCLGRKLDFEDPEGVRVFLQHGADPNFVVPGRSGGTRLHGAIRGGRSAATIDVLVQYGADISAKTEEGFTPYALAVRTGHTSAVEVLHRHGATNEELTDTDRFLGACMRGDRDQVARALAEQPNIVSQLAGTDRGLLALAAEQRKLDAMRVMLEAGFDATVFDAQRMQPLHWAAWFGNPAMVAELLKYGAPLEQRNGYGGTPLGAAVYGAANCHDPHGGSTAGGSVDHGRHDTYADAVRQLLSAGADPKSVGSYPSGIEAIDSQLRPHLESATDESRQQLWVHPHVRDAERAFRAIVGSDYTAIPLRDQLSLQADALLAAHQRGDGLAPIPIKNWFPPLIGFSFEDILRADFTLDDARLTVAREHGFDDWQQVQSLDQRMVDPQFEQAVDALVDGDLESLGRLLGEKPDLVQARSPYGHRATLLHYVAANGVETRRQKTPPNAVEMAELLLEAGADPDALAETYGGGPAQTTLCLLVSSGHPDEVGVTGELVELLCSCGANPDGIENDGLPVATALGFGISQAAEALARGGANVSNVVYAAALGRTEDIRQMLDANGHLKPGAASVSNSMLSISEDPRQALEQAMFYACRNRRLEVIKLLLDVGVTPDSANDQNETALHWAAHEGWRDVAELLLDRGADIAIRDHRWNCSPVGWAMERDRREFAEWLVAHGKPDFVDVCGLGLTDRAREMLEQNPTLANGLDGNGAPLRVAAANGHLQMVELLLQQGADTELANSEGHTALDWAARNGHRRVAELLDNHRKEQRTI